MPILDSARRTTIIITILVGISSPAFALTAGEVIDRMDTGQRSGFVTGAVEMYAQLTERAGEAEKAEGAMEWYRSPASVVQIRQVFSHYKDKVATAVLEALINRHCKKE